MGVHGLWELLAPVGRRVFVETLAGKKLAIAKANETERVGKRSGQPEENAE